MGGVSALDFQKGQTVRALLEINDLFMLIKHYLTQTASRIKINQAVSVRTKLDQTWIVKQAPDQRGLKVDELVLGKHGGYCILEFPKARGGYNVDAAHGRVWIFSGITQ